MNKLICLLVLIPTFSVADVLCRVVGISDGDILTCLTNANQQIKVRLNQIDAPDVAVHKL